MESETPSQKNKPQAVKRGITGIKTNAKKLVEDGNVPLVTVYIHPESDKCTFLLDSVSAEAFKGSLQLNDMFTSKRAKIRTDMAA